MALQNTQLRFYHASLLGSTGSTIVATSTSTTADFSVDFLHNNLETNGWQATSSATQTLLLDLGVGNSGDADYLIIYGHNLSGSTVQLQSSTSTAFSGEESTLVHATPATNTIFFQEFTTVGAKRYSRLVISGMTTAPFMNILAWGTRSTIANIQPPFDPYEERASANVNISQGGLVTGIHTKFVDRTFNINLPNSSTATYAAVRNWHDNSGLNNFFMAWDSTANPADVFLVRPDLRFANPFNANHLRDISIRLTGRKET